MSSNPPAKSGTKAVIGRYEVVKRVGAGGMGAVYKAIDLDLHREVALKILPPDMASKPEMLERFHQEAQHAAKLRHEHIVTLYECGESKGTFFLAMEFVDGINLHEYIDSKGRLDAEEARKLMVQAAKALTLAHAHSIVHRDIKPSNFLLTQKDGQPFVKLTDFGLARNIDNTDFKVTKTGTTVGTVDYIAPEQARNSRAADIRSDIYSLGCTLYHMLAGQPPFPDGDMTERLLKHLEAEPADVRKFNPAVPAGLVVVLKRMLEKKPEDRYPTPTELLKDLEQLPLGPPLSSRELLEGLALAANEKPKPKRPSQTNIHTRPAVEATRPLGPPPPVPLARLRYRKTKDRPQREPPSRPKSLIDEPSRTSPFIIEGWKPWVMIGGLAAVAGLVAVALILGWGAPSNSQPQPILPTSAPENFAVKAPDKGTPTDPKQDANPAQPPEQGGPKGTVPDNPPVQTQQPTPNTPRPADPGTKPPDLPRVYDPPPQAIADLREQFQMLQPRPSGNQAAPAPYEPPSNLPPGTSGPPNKPPIPAGPQPQPENSGNKGGPTPSQPANPGPQVKPAPSHPVNPVPAGNPPQPRPVKFVGPVQPSELRPESSVLVVRRIGTGGNGPYFTTLAEACAAALPNRETIIEIRDNGPLFETPVQISGRRIVIRPAQGYRPLLAWDVQSGGVARAPYLFSISQGFLTLENLDLVVKCADTGSAELAGLIRVENGELAAENCTVSVAVRQRSNFAVVQLAGGACKCRLDHCYLRGADVTALSVLTPQAEIMLRGCLIVGGSRPLFDILGKNPVGASPVGAWSPDHAPTKGDHAPTKGDHAPTKGDHVSTKGDLALTGTSLRIAQSTLVAGQTMLRIRPASVADKEPAFHFLGWDTLLARYGNQAGGDLLELQEGIRATNMKWQAVNGLYTGWQTLLRGTAETIAATDLKGWHALWRQEAGDAALEPTWPAVVEADPSETLPANFRATGHVAYGGTAGASSLGCDLSALPPVRDKWLWLTYDRYTPPDFYVPRVGEAPEISNLPEGIFHGGRLDVSAVDLGAYLREMLRTHRVDRKIVMRLYGKGKSPTSPIRIHGISLVLYFEPSAKEEDRPYLVPADAGEREALIGVEDGSLDLVGASIRYPNARSANVPGYLLKVTGGDLRVAGCELKGALGQSPNAYQGLIRFVSAGGSPGEPMHECAVVDSVLLSGKICIQSGGAGTRVRLNNCVAVAGDEIFHLDPNLTPTPRQRAQCILDHNTIAARRAVLRLSDGHSWTPPVEPVLVQARANVFLAAFGAISPRSALLVYEGEALTHGGMVWQEEGSVYDQMIRDYAALEQTAVSVAPQPEALWTRLWGPLGERRPFVRQWPRDRLFDLDTPRLERLALPDEIQQQIKGRTPGANFEQLAQLGLLKKPVKKPKGQ